MKAGKLIKKMIYVSFAVLVAVTLIPDHLSVKAAGSGADSYPDEVYFPIKVIDFPQDSLLFEWMDTTGADKDLELYQDYYHQGKGKGLVEDTLGPDGLPVYKKKTVETIAQAVQRRLHWGHSRSPVLNKPNHYLNVKTYLDRRRGESILVENTNANVSDTTMWVPDSGSGRLVKRNNETVTYTYPTGTGCSPSSFTYNNVYAEVYDDAISSDMPIYILKKDAIIFFYNVSVSRTFTLTANTSYNLSGWGQQSMGNTEVLIEDKDPQRVMTNTSGEVVTTGADGKIKVTIRVGAGLSVSTPVGAPLTDAMTLYGQKYGVWNIRLVSNRTDAAYLGTNPNGGAVIYPLGDYDESKAKFDGDENLGWTDMRTCMDYAYFVTSHFFKSHASWGEQFNQFDNLIFHKLEEKDPGTGETKIAYEFAAARRDAGAGGTRLPVYPLLYNWTERTIRNVYGSDTGDSTRGDYRIDGGSMFIVDSAVKQYPVEDPKLYAVDGRQHNFHYSISSHSQFVYKEGAGQYFEFVGDDDVYVFVDKHLYIDLGGAHVPLNGKFNLDDIAAAHPEWGIVSGKVVSLDLFYLERHTDQANFYAKMNLKLETDRMDINLPNEVVESGAMPYGYLVDLNYSLATKRELVRNKNITITDNLGNVIGAKDFKLVEGVSLKYKSETDRGTGVLKVTVKKEKKDANGNTVKDANGNAIVEVDATRSKTFEFPGLFGYDPANGVWKKRDFTSAEVAEVKNYFANLELMQGDSLELDGPQYDTSYKRYTEYMDDPTDPMSEGRVNFKPEASYEIWQEGARVPTKGHSDGDFSCKLVVGNLKVCAAQTDNDKKKLADYGEFTIERDLYGESEYAKQPYIGSGTAQMPYTNNTSILTITEDNFYEVPRGKYKIKLDDSVLTSYKVTVNGEEVTELIIDFEPKYDRANKMWVFPGDPSYLGDLDNEPKYDDMNKAWIYPGDPGYPEDSDVPKVNYQFELKAKRLAPDLKNLT